MCPQTAQDSTRRNTSSASKVKVMYIDPLSREEEDKVNRMSVDEIVNTRTASGGLSREGTSMSVSGDVTARHDVTDGHVGGGGGVAEEARQRPSRINSSKGGGRSSRPNSNCSHHSERSVQSPKLKTLPVHSGANRSAEDLGIISYGARNHPPVNEMPRTAKTPGRISPSKPLHRSGSSGGQSSSIRAGPMPGDTEYVKISTPLKTNGPPAPGSGSDCPTRPTTYPSYNFSPRSNTPRDPDYQLDVYHDNVRAASDFDTRGGHHHSRPINTTPRQQQHYAAGNKDSAVAAESNVSFSIQNTASALKSPPNELDPVSSPREEVDPQEQQPAASVTSESPTPTTVAISIPTADELSDRESPSNSPSRHHDDGLTQKQRRERDMRNEQIGQITDLIGTAIIDS